MANRDVQVKIILNEFKHLFADADEWKINNLKTGGNILYVPYRINLDENDGLLLKNNAGFISIQETFDQDKVLSYVYRFSSKEYQCLTCKYDITSDVIPLGFHYDSCENDLPHEPHVSVIYPSIRYISKKIELREFLSFIQNNFFVNRSNPGSCIWDNR